MIDTPLQQLIVNKRIKKKLRNLTLYLPHEKGTLVIFHPLNSLISLTLGYIINSFFFLSGKKILI